MNKLNFNDSSVAKFFNKQSAAVLEVDDVHYNGELAKVTIKVEGLKTLQADSAPESYEFKNIPNLEMLTEDGNVIAFEHDEISLTVLITWHEHSPYKSHTRNYKVIGQSVSIDVGALYPDER